MLTPSSDCSAIRSALDVPSRSSPGIPVFASPCVIISSAPSLCLRLRSQLEPEPESDSRRSSLRGSGEARACFGVGSPCDTDLWRPCAAFPLSSSPGSNLVLWRDTYWQIQQGGEKYNSTRRIDARHASTLGSLRSGVRHVGNTCSPCIACCVCLQYVKPTRKLTGDNNRHALRGREMIDCRT